MPEVLLIVAVVLLVVVIVGQIALFFRKARIDLSPGMIAGKMPSPCWGVRKQYGNTLKAIPRPTRRPETNPPPNAPAAKIYSAIHSR